jgi:hypothetical protein
MHYSVGVETEPREKWVTHISGELKVVALLINVHCRSRTELWINLKQIIQENKDQKVTDSPVNVSLDDNFQFFTYDENTAREGRKLH